MKGSSASLPSASSPTIRTRMQNTAQRNTRPELRLRSALHRLGLRYRVHAAPLKGVRRHADIVFPRQRIAVFVDGCFWHSCPDHATFPKANRDWWEEKLQANRDRDEDTDRRLRANGWESIRVWEHEDAQNAAVRIEAAVRARQALPGVAGR
jgi:DNA mismatch endonuclease, patch repair protein